MTFEALKVGDRIAGRVSRISAFGAFIELDNSEWHGLVRIPEISWLRIAHPADVLAVGQAVETQILHIDAEGHQISLSIKRCEENPWESIVQAYVVGQTVEAVVSRIARFYVAAHLKLHPRVEGLIPAGELGQRSLSVGQAVKLLIVEFKPDQQQMQFAWLKQ